jgi:hypothetical protein
VIGPRSVQSWTHGFADGDNSLEDTPSSDRPRSAENLTEIRQLLADDRYLSQKRIAFILNIYQATIKRIFCEELSVRKFNVNSIAHRLYDGQKSKIARLSRKLLEFRESKSGSSPAKHIQKMKRRFIRAIGNRACALVMKFADVHFEHLTCHPDDEESSLTRPELPFSTDSEKVKS